jgi:hypothetical protein
VLRGEIVVGKLVRLAVERHYRDLQTAGDRGLVFMPEFSWHIIGYIEKYFVHIKGDLLDSRSCLIRAEVLDGGVVRLAARGWSAPLHPGL